MYVSPNAEGALPHAFRHRREGGNSECGNVASFFFTRVAQRRSDRRPESCIEQLGAETMMKRPGAAREIVNEIALLVSDDAGYAPAGEGCSHRGFGYFDISRIIVDIVFRWI